MMGVVGLAAAIRGRGSGAAFDAARGGGDEAGRASTNPPDAVTKRIGRHCRCSSQDLWVSQTAGGDAARPYPIRGEEASFEADQEPGRNRYSPQRARLTGTGHPATTRLRGSSEPGFRPLPDGRWQRHMRLEPRSCPRAGSASSPLPALFRFRKRPGRPPHRFVGQSAGLIAAWRIRRIPRRGSRSERPPPPPVR
jgi:hypothetical protein